MKTVDEESVLRYVDRVVRDTLADRLELDDVERAEVRRMVRARFGVWLDRQPEYPPLVGVTEAARILGARTKSRVGRLVERGLLREPWEIEGGRPAWPRKDVEDLARQLGENGNQPKEEA